jgi:hypothetical protein
MAHVPPPPQADGRNILLDPSVLRIVDPASTTMSFSPFTLSVTGPEGASFALAARSRETNIKTTARKTAILTTITVDMLRSTML